MHISPTQSNSAHMTDHTQTSLDFYICKRPHPFTVISLQKLNKRLRKQDWHPQLWGGYTLSLSLAFRTDYLPNDLRPKGSGTYHGTQPSRPVWPCCGKTWQSKRLLSVTFVQSISSGNLLSSLFIYCLSVMEQGLMQITLKSSMNTVLQKNNDFYSSIVVGPLYPVQ